MVDEETFVREVTAMERTLYRVSRGMLKSPADCGDAVQEAIKKAWEKRSKAEEGFFRPWLMRITINECRNVMRAKRRIIPVADVPLAEAPEAPDHALRDAVFSLPVALRMPLILNCLEGFTVQETARLLNMPQGTVKWRLYKAREQLRKALDEQEARI